MRDCRTILEKFYETRGTMRAEKWLLLMDEIEGNTPEVELTEKTMCRLILDVRKFLLTNRRNISHRELRTMMNEKLEVCKDDYIGEIQDLPALLELFDCQNDGEISLEDVMTDIRKIFQYCYYF